MTSEKVDTTKYSRVMLFCTSLCEKGNRGIVLLFFQSIAGSSRLDGCDKVWDHLSQNLTVS